jgi:hypothetical protein
MGLASRGSRSNVISMRPPPGLLSDERTVQSWQSAQSIARPRSPIAHAKRNDVCRRITSSNNSSIMAHGSRAQEARSPNNSATATIPTRALLSILSIRATMPTIHSSTVHTPMMRGTEPLAKNDLDSRIVELRVARVAKHAERSDGGFTKDYIYCTLS